MRGGWAQRDIENGTFNTVKVQGCHSGTITAMAKKLSVVLAMVIMPAFLVDQTQPWCCPLFQTAWLTCGYNN
ncbi:MAG: hypothetical protein NTV55_08215 [Planctomycetota bacterium]|nr:hypothetical protein [Planctomycetota bacterium]